MRVAHFLFISACTRTLSWQNWTKWIEILNWVEFCQNRKSSIFFSVLRHYCSFWLKSWDTSTTPTLSPLRLVIYSSNEMRIDLTQNKFAIYLLRTALIMLYLIKLILFLPSLFPWERCLEIRTTQRAWFAINTSWHRRCWLRCPNRWRLTWSRGTWDPLIYSTPTQTHIHNSAMLSLWRRVHHETCHADRWRDKCLIH